jgi:hypothetical protein
MTSSSMGISQILSEVRQTEYSDEAIEKRLKEFEKTYKKENKIQKLKWLGKPEQFAYIFLELVEKGYIDMPSTKGDGSYALLAKQCFELFEFKKGSSVENLKRAMNPNKNALSETNRAKITIPELKDIS